MKLLLNRYECKDCKKMFKSPDLDESSYGEFLMRSKTGVMIYLNSFEKSNDIIFTDVSNILKQHTLISKMDDRNQAVVLHNIYDSVVDKSNDGSNFSMIQYPLCPICKNCNIEKYGPIYPYEIVDVELKKASFNHWNSLTKEQRFNVIDEAVKNYVSTRH